MICADCDGNGKLTIVRTFKSLGPIDLNRLWLKVQILRVGYNSFHLVIFDVSLSNSIETDIQLCEQTI